MAWVEEKNKAAAVIASTVSDASSQRTTSEFTIRGRLIPYKWRSPSPHELGKHAIRRRQHTYNNNGSWKLDTNPASSVIPEDSAAATTIVMSITAQKTASRAHAAAFAAAKAIMLQTIMGERNMMLMLHLRLLRTKQTKFIGFRQIYPIVQQQLKEYLVISGSSELKKNSLSYSAPEMACIQTIVLVAMQCKLN